MGKGNRVSCPSCLRTVRSLSFLPSSEFKDRNLYENGVCITSSPQYCRAFRWKSAWTLWEGCTGSGISTQWTGKKWYWSGWTREWLGRSINILTYFNWRKSYVREKSSSIVFRNCTGSFFTYTMPQNDISLPLQNLDLPSPPTCYDPYMIYLLYLNKWNFTNYDTLHLKWTYVIKIYAYPSEGSTSRVRRKSVLHIDLVSTSIRSFPTLLVVPHLSFPMASRRHEVRPGNVSTSVFSPRKRIGLSFLNYSRNSSTFTPYNNNRFGVIVWVYRVYIFKITDRPRNFRSRIMFVEFNWLNWHFWVSIRKGL